MLLVSSPNDGGNTHATRLVGAQKQALLAEAWGPTDANGLGRSLMCYTKRFPEMYQGRLQKKRLMFLHQFQSFPVNCDLMKKSSWLIRTPQIQISHLAHKHEQYSGLKPATNCDFISRSRPPDRDVLGVGPLICWKLTQLLDGVDLPMVPGEGKISG